MAALCKETLTVVRNRVVVVTCERERHHAGSHIAATESGGEWPRPDIELMWRT